MKLRLEETEVDLSVGAIRKPGHELRMTSMECALLTYLFESRHQPVPREELLREVWGYDPTVQTRTDYVTLHALRRKLDDRRWVVTHRGRGFQLGESVQKVPDMWSPWPEIPRFGSFVGRELERAALRAALDGGTPITVVSGGPGIGKSHLVAEVLAGMPNVIWGSALGLPEGATLSEVLAEQLGIVLDVTDQASRGALLRACVARKVTVVVFDQVERFVDELAEWSSELRQFPSVQLVVTTQVLLPLLRVEEIRLEPLDNSTMHQLLTERLGVALEQDSGVERLVTLLDGLPLAAVLILPRLRALPPHVIAEALAKNPLLPGVELRDISETHTSLSRALSWSWSLLEPDAQRTATLMCRFAHAARYVEILELVGEQASSSVQQLVERGLLSISRRSGALYYRVGSAVRAFGLQQPLSATDREALKAWTTLQIDRAFAARYTADWNREHQALRHRWPTLQVLIDMLALQDRARLSVVLAPVLRGWAPAALDELLDGDYGALPDDIDLELAVCRIDADRRARRREPGLQKIAEAEARHPGHEARGRLAILRAFQSLADVDGTAAIAYAESGLRHLGGTGYHDLVGQAALALGHWYSGDASAARNSLTALVASLQRDESNVPVEGTDFVNALVAVSLDVGSPMEPLLETAAKTVERMGDWFGEAALNFNRARWHLENGRFDMARASLSETARIHASLGRLSPDPRTVLIGALVDLCEGHAQQVLQTLARFADRLEESRETRLWRVVLTELAFIHLGQHNRLGDARDTLATILADGPVPRTQVLLLARDLVLAGDPVSEADLSILHEGCTGRVLLRWLLPTFGVPCEG